MCDFMNPEKCRLCLAFQGLKIRYVMYSLQQSRKQIFEYSINHGSLEEIHFILFLIVWRIDSKHDASMI